MRKIFVFSAAGEGAGSFRATALPGFQALKASSSFGRTVFSVTSPATMSTAFPGRQFAS